MEKEVKVRITTDASGGVTGFKMIRDEMERTESSSKRITGLIKNHWINISTFYQDVKSIAQQGWDLMGTAADYNERLGAVASMGAQYEMTGSQIVRATKEASRGLVSLSEAADMSASALNLSLSPSQVMGYTREAEKLSDVIGGTIPEGFNRMVVAAASGRTMTLAQMGIIVELESMYQKYADSLGRTKDSLSEYEKQQARIAGILEAAQQKTALLGEAQDSFRDKMDRMSATVKDLEEMIGQGLIRVVSGAAGAFEWLAAGALTVTAAFPLLMKYVSLASAKIYEWTGQTDRMKRELAEVESFDKAVDDMMGAAQDLTGRAADKFNIMTSSVEELAAASGKHFPKINTDLGNVDSKAKSLLESWRETQMSLTEKIGEHGLDDLSKQLLKNQFDVDKLKDKFKELPASIKQSAYALIDKYKGVMDVDAITDAEKRGAASYERMVNDIVESSEKAAQDRLNAERDLYADLRGYEDSYYAASLSLIESQVTKYREMKVDEVAITAWAEEEKRKAKLKYDRETGTAGAGWTEGLSDWRKNLQSEFEYGEDLAKTTAQSMSKSFSNLLFDATKGDLSDFSTYFESFLESILRKFTDKMGDMITEWIMSIDYMKAYTEASNFNVSGIISAISGLFGGSSGAGLGIVSGGTAAEAAAAGAIVLHGGGVAGIDPAPMRYVSAAAFAGAPRYHKGFMADEVPAILKRGESVLTPAQMQAVGSQNSGGTTNIYIHAVDSKSVEELVRRNKTIFQQVNLQGLRDNQTRAEMKALLK